MNEPLRLRVWRELSLLPVLLWLVAGLLFIPSLRSLLRQPVQSQQRANLRAELEVLSAALRQDPSGSGADLTALLFSRPPQGDRLVLVQGGDRILADTQKDSSLWLTPPGAAVARAVEWRLGPEENRPASDLSSRLAFHLEGSDPAGALSLFWFRSREAPDARVRRVLTALTLVWIGLAFLLAFAGWRGAGQVERTFRGLREELARLKRGVEPGPAVGPGRGADTGRGVETGRGSETGRGVETGRGSETGRGVETGRPIEREGRGRRALADDPLDLVSDLERIRRRMQRSFEEGQLESRERDAIFEGMAEGVLALDASLRILLLNGAAASMLSLSEASPVGTRLPETVRSSALHQYVQDLAGSNGELGTEPPPLELETQGGRKVLRVRGTVLREADGRPRGFVLVLTDVTDTRRLERIRKDFVDNVSHELKTPLTTLRGYVETLIDGAHDDPATRLSFLRTVHTNVERMHRIVEDLLSLSRIESQGKQIERQWVRPADLLRRVVDELHPEAERCHVRLVIEAETREERCLLNAFMIERALSNLIDNAVKYGGQGKEVHVQALRLGDTLVLRVTDEGAGIPPAHLERLFERFYRVDRGRSRELGGTGLGLAIVKHVAMAHGGEALVESSPGKGAVFTLRIPWLKTEQDRPAVEDGAVS